ITAQTAAGVPGLPVEIQSKHLSVAAVRSEAGLCPSPFTCMSIHVHAHRANMMPKSRFAPSISAGRIGYSDLAALRGKYLVILPDDRAHGHRPAAERTELILLCAAIMNDTVCSASRNFIEACTCAEQITGT